MANRVNQSTIPSFNTETSLISPMLNRTILFCEDFNSERRNFIVVDETSLVASGGSTTVQTAYDNLWIVDFPKDEATLGRIDDYIFGFNGGDYNSNQEGFQTGKLFIKDKTLFKVYKNGVLLTAADWGFNNVASFMFPASRSQSFTVVVAPLPADVYIFHYQETVTLGSDYKIKLTSTEGYLKSAKTTKTLHVSGWGNGWCKWISQTGFNEFDVEYILFSDPSDSRTVTKRYPNHFRLAEWEDGFDFSTLNLELEIYRSKSRRSRGAISRSGGGEILTKITTTNSVNLASLGDEHSYSGVYRFRFRNTLDNTYSDFFDTKLVVKKSPLVVTDPSLSASQIIGTFINAYLM